MVLNTAYQSFSVLGFCINFVVGGVLIILGLVARYGAFRLRALRRMKNGSEDAEYKSMGEQAWLMNGLLQLQRLAYESQGLGRWHHQDNESIPLTTADELFPWPEPPPSTQEAKAEDVDSSKIEESKQATRAAETLVNVAEKVFRTEIS